jgi:hypothetical protein
MCHIAIETVCPNEWGLTGKIKAQISKQVNQSPGDINMETWSFRLGVGAQG